MNFRDILFFGKDAANGFSISSHMKEIRKALEEKNNSGRLKDLLNHAVKTVPYYNTQNPASILDFPIVNKSIIKSNEQKFLSNEFADKKEKLIKMTTSGSTGTPFTVYQNKNKRQRNWADTLVFENLAGYQLGHRLLYFKIWAKEKLASNWVYKAQNMVPIEVIKLDDSIISNLLSDIHQNKSQIHSAIGYVSALEEILRYCEKNNITDLGAKFSTVITISEALDMGAKEKLMQLFKCPVVSRYSNLENGILAQQTPTSYNSFLVNTASYYIEILDFEKDEPVNQGEKGRIVVTDLYNYAMPMIRYDTGDIGSVEYDKDGRLYLKSVEGRKLDLLFDTSANVVSSYIMYKNMWKYTEISQYQLIQTGEKDYTFKINCHSKFEKEKQLVSEFKEFLGDDANFVVEYVDEIVLLDSGKRRKTVNLYRKSI